VIVALSAVPPRAGVGSLLLIVPAVLAGEVSIGLSNDAADAPRDRLAGRADKPIATGQLARRTAWVAAGVALASSVVLCFLVSQATGVINLMMMAAGWAYNLGLKSTVWSGPAYLVGFGLIPAFAASTFPAGAHARPWGYAAAALLGLGGHFTNVLPDLDGDERSGVRGQPQRLAGAGRYGPPAVRVLAFAMLLTATGLIAAAQWADHPVTTLVGVVLVLAVAVAGLLGRGKLPFFAALAIAVVDVLILIFGVSMIVES
jgi:4-hydroxybenzoate polyprenyltransferase